MSDAAIFFIVFCGLFVLRIIAATVVFYYIIPCSDRCPNCDSVTLHVEATGWDRLLPWLRCSWCIECGWNGMLRPVAPSRPLAQTPIEKQHTHV